MAPKKKPEPEKEEPPPEEVAEPPPPPEPTEDELTELSTGLQLPLRGLDVSRIWALGDALVAQARLLTELLRLEEVWPSTTQRQIVCEFYIFNLAQAKALCLSPLQGAVFHAILAKVLELMVCPGTLPQAAPKDLPFDTKRGFEEFTSLLLKHSVSNPPERLAVFKVSEAKLITDFASVTLFKHFLLYQFCINCPQEVQTMRVRRTLQRPLPPPDLNAARSRPRPRGWRKKQQAEEAADAAAGAEGDAAATSRDLPEGADGAGGGAEELSPEEMEMNRIVEEKLREKEAELEAEFAAREEAFMARLAAKQEELAAAKGKKK